MLNLINFLKFGGGRLWVNHLNIMILLVNFKGGVLRDANFPDGGFRGVAGDNIVDNI